MNTLKSKTKIFRINMKVYLKNMKTIIQKFKMI